MADLALGELRDLDLHLVAEDRLGQLELELVAQVRAAKHLRAPAAAGAAEDVAEDIAEDVAEGVGAETPATAAAPRGLKTGMTVLVVRGALVRIGEDLVGFLGLLELLLGLLIARIAIGVIFHRQAPVGLFDLSFGRGLRNIQDLVIVALRHALTLRKPCDSDP